MNIREANPDDAATIVDFQLRMAWETEQLRLEPDCVQRGVAAVFDDPTKGRYFVATRQDAVVASLLTMPEWSDWRNGTVLWIHSVYVLPEARRQGVFRRMYAHLEELVLADPALRGLRLYVDRRNETAQNVYRGLGMDGSHYALYEWLKG